MSRIAGLFGKLVLATLLFCFFLSTDMISIASSISEKTSRFSMSYVYFGGSGAYTGYVDGTGGSLDDISPSYFDLNDDGTLKLTIAVDRNFIRQMHNRGVRVTPFLSNHWNRQTGINALANRELLSSQVAAAIQEYDLDGVNVDIENVTEQERESYTDFVRLLREKLPSGKGLSVAVAPNPYGLTTGWYGAYDFAQLAKYSDYLMLMTYDEHYQGGPEGPVAGYPFVEKTIQAALRTVPSDKLVLGLPFYGRLWKQGMNYGGYGISNNTVDTLIAKYRGKVTYDSAQKSPMATITVLGGDEKPSVFGKTLDAGKYNIWFENEASLKSKLSLVNKYNLKGAGSWSLGQESRDTWNYYSLWLNGYYFGDAQNSWARQSILSMIGKGWMVGVSGTQFQPESPVTRAQAAVVLVRALGIDSKYYDGATSFTDTANHWARAEIEAASRNGIVRGIGNGKFDPDATLTREQMAVLLDRIMKPGTTPGSAFPDVTAEGQPWSYEAINRIAAAGILQGYPDGGFHPGDIIRRSQMATLMDRSVPYLANGIVAATD